jgi:2-dehydro-3-deoxyphosphogluconate aldolase/(4S)-4-hydroxy-2-oxoglutarate aldolase
MTADRGVPPQADQASPADALLSCLSQSGLLPVLRASSQASLVEQVDMCLEAGLTILELTTTSPGWDEVLVRLKTDPQCAHVLVGVGTVISSALADSARARGADFLVTPYRALGLNPFRPAPVEGVRPGETSEVEKGSLSQVQGSPPVIHGAFSPSELAEAHRSGGGVTKLFPASVLGPAYLKSVLQVLPGAAIVPTGGLTADSARAWVQAGALAVGMGGHLFDGGAAGVRTLQQALIQTRADMAGTD